MNIMTRYYRMACYYLKDHISYIPDLKLTNAKGYMGQIDVENQVIRISKFHHVDSLWLMDSEDRYEIIDTICHELAHTVVFQHDNLHKRLTKAFTTIVLNCLEIAELEQELEQSGGVSNVS